MKISLESFLAVVKRSGLIPADRLQAELEAFQSRSGSAGDAQAFAEHLTERNLVTPWQTEKLLQGKHKGFFLGKYRLLSLLGKGGMSSVYLAEHVLMRRRCAIKVLPAKRVNDTSYLGRFHREAQAVAALDHPNIVRAYDVDHEKDGNVEIHFLVMEYVDGSSLLDLVNRDGPLSPVVAAEYIRQAALGLEHAHRAGLIHRDIKPGNLLVDSSGVVKVMDLGLARFFTGQDDESLTIQYDEKVLGTADYLAPEQAVDSHAIDARADIYSLGCTLYFLLTGHPPFPQGTLPQRLMAHQTKEPTPLEQQRPDVSPKLAAIVRRMMAKKPDDRYPTAAATAEALVEWLSAEGGAAWNELRSKLATAGIDPGTSSTRTSSLRLGESAPATPAAPPPAPAPPEDDNLGAFLARLSGVDRPAVPAGAPPEPEPTLPPAPPARGTPAPQPRGSDSSTRQRGRTAVAAPAASAPTAPSAPRTSSPSSKIRKTAAPAAAAPAATPVAAEPPVVEAVLAEPVEAEPAAVDTPLSAPPTGATSPLRRASRRRQTIPPQYWIYGGAGAGVLLVVAITISLMSGGGETPPVPTPPTPTPNTAAATPASPTTVSPPRPARPLPASPAEVTVGPTGNFATITEALAYVLENPPLAPNETRLIKVAGGQTYPERIDVTSWNFGVLHIRSDGEQRAVLKPKGAGPVLSINGSSRVRIEGLRIDAADQSAAVRLTGVLNGTQLANLEIVGFREVGIEGDRAVGLNSGRLELRDLVLTARRSEAHGIRFTAPSLGSFAGGIEQVTFANVTCIGPFDVGLRLAGTLRQVTVQKCRFHNLKTGIELDLAEAEVERVLVENNTFHKLARGLALQGSPTGISEWTIQKNLFLGLTGPEVDITNVSDAALANLKAKGRVSHNWTDRPADAAGQNRWDLFANQGKTAIGDVEFASTEPSAGDFLQPRRGDLRVPQAPGADKFIGALPP